MINQEEKEQIEENTTTALKKTATIPKAPNLIQKGKVNINISNLGSGNINFTGMTLDELSNKLGQLTAVPSSQKPFKAYKQDKSDLLFIFDEDDQCIGTLVDTSYFDRFNSTIKEKDILIEELRQRIADLKEEIAFLRSKVK